MLRCAPHCADTRRPERRCLERYNVLVAPATRRRSGSADRTIQQSCLGPLVMHSWSFDRLLSTRRRITRQWQRKGKSAVQTRPSAWRPNLRCGVADPANLADIAASHDLSINVVATRCALGESTRDTQEMVCAGRNPLRCIARQQKSLNVRLGVKWSQVHILSARLGNMQVRGHFWARASGRVLTGCYPSSCPMAARCTPSSYVVMARQPTRESGWRI